MSGVVPVSPKFQFSTTLGVPLSGGSVDVYLAGSTTRSNTWQDKDQTTLNTNPIILDASGSCTIFGADNKTYKFVVKDSLGVTQTHLGADNITCAGSTTDIAAAAATASQPYVAAAAASAAAALVSETNADASEAQAATYAAASATSAKFYDTIALGLAAVADGATFGVKAGGTDGLTRATVYRRDSASTQTLLYAVVAGAEFDDTANATALAFGGVESIGNDPIGVTSSGASGVYVFNDTVAHDGYLKTFSVWASATGALLIKRFTKSGNDFTVVGSGVSVTIGATGLNTFTATDFGLIKIEAGEYLGFSQTANRVSYKNVVGIGYFYGATPGATTFTDSAADTTISVQAKFIIAEATTDLLNDVTDHETRIDSLEARTQIETDGELLVRERLGLDAVPASQTGDAGAGIWILGVPASHAGTVDTVYVYSNAADTGKVVVLSKSGTLYSKSQEYSVSFAPGLNVFSPALAIAAGEYVGLETNTSGALAFQAATSTGHDGFYSGNTPHTYPRTASALTTTSALQFAADMTVVYAHPADGKSRWNGQTLVTFGDSITAQDGVAYPSTHIQSGTVAVGYQSYVRSELGAVIDNQGVSGKTMPEIYTNQISPYNFAGKFAATINSGANDHRRNITPGSVAAIGATFNTATFAGALQAAIEHVIASNPDTKIFLITPVKGYFFESGTSDVPGPYNGETSISATYVTLMTDIAKLYSLTVCDWYYASGINALNYRTGSTPKFLGDNPAVFTAYALHPTQAGYALLGRQLVETLKRL